MITALTSQGQYHRHTYRVVPVTVAAAPVQNLLLWSEDLSNAVWSKSDMTITTNTSGVLDSCSITSFTGGEILYQEVNLSALTTYYFSFDVIRGTKTDVAYGIRDWATDFSWITAETSYYSSTSSTVTRLQYSFTTLSGGSTVRIFPIMPQFVSGGITLGRFQLATSATATYGTTTTAIIP